MSLSRVHTPLSQVIIRALFDSGGPRADQVAAELGNLIAWVRSSPRCINRDFSVVNSAGVGPDVLHTFSLPANSLEADGDYLTVWYGGSFAVNDRDKTVQAQFDNQDYIAGGAVDLDANTGWVLPSRIMRIDSTHVVIGAYRIANTIAVDSANAPQTFTEGGYVQGRSITLTVANLNSNAITMRVRSVVGAGAAAADVFQNMSIIELVQQ